MQCAKSSWHLPRHREYRHWPPTPQPVTYKFVDMLWSPGSKRYQPVDDRARDADRRHTTRSG